MSFNPHTHAGCDAVSPSTSAVNVVSIHTPTQGVTKIRPQQLNSIFVSIHTPTQGVTSGHVINYDCGAVSIHTPTQGVTASMAQARASMMFQSTHPRRV